MDHEVHYGLQEQEHYLHHHQGLDHMNNHGVMGHEEPGENGNSTGCQGDGSGGSDAMDGDVAIDPGNLSDNQNVVVVRGVNDCGNQLTLSFQGQVYVFDSVSPEKVQAVLLLLGGQEIPPNIPSIPVNAVNGGVSSTPQRLNVPQRLASLIRFREKRKERNFDKKIRYTVRKEVALRMQRNKGQFTSSKPNHDDTASAASSWDSSQSLAGDGSQQPETFCRHCGISEKSTPMMRKGPEGPRTLCNACGLMWANKGTLRDLSRAASHPGQTSFFNRNEENGNLEPGCQLVQSVKGDENNLS